jgi:hypothetical protein
MPEVLRFYRLGLGVKTLLIIPLDIHTIVDHGTTIVLTVPIPS